MSKEENLSKLIQLFSARLQSRGIVKHTDTNGNEVYIDSNIFSEDTIISFFELSLSDFNQVPNFTNFSLNDDKFVNQFTSILVEGAIIYALGSQALIEKGREFKLNDSGIKIMPPNISEILNNQYSELLQLHWDKLKYIKLNIGSLYL